MATAKKAASKKTQTARGRAQDRALVAATQKWEVSYEASKTGHSAAEVKAAIAKLGHSRVKVTKALESAPTKKVAKKAAKRAP